MIYTEQEIDDLAQKFMKGLIEDFQSIGAGISDVKKNFGILCFTAGAKLVNEHRGYSEIHGLNTEGLEPGEEI